VLTREGFKVLSATDGADALDVVAGANASIQLLVTDVVMPNMRGPELSRRLTREHPGLPTLFLSGNPKEALSDDRGLVPGTHFLAKPFRAAAFVEAVRSTLSAA